MSHETDIIGLIIINAFAGVAGVNYPVGIPDVLPLSLLFFFL